MGSIEIPILKEEEMVTGLTNLEVIIENEMKENEWNKWRVKKANNPEYKELKRCTVIMKKL